jgi:hypothetical protein
MTHAQKTIYFTLFLYIITNAAPAAAQVIKTDTARQRPTQIIIIDDNKDAESKQQKKQKYIAYPQHFVKVRPFSIITGKLPIYFETIQNQRFGYEVGLGITTKNWVFNDFYTLDYGNIGNTILGRTTRTNTWNTATDTIVQPVGRNRDQTLTTYKIGWIASGALKYYYNQTADTRSYFSLLIDHRRHLSSVGSYAGFDVNTGFIGFDNNKTLAQSLNSSNISMNFGVNNYINNFMVDFYVGVGVRYLVNNTVIFADDANIMPLNGVSKFTNRLPIITSGLAIGLKL